MAVTALASTRLFAAPTNWVSIAVKSEGGRAFYGTGYGETPESAKQRALDLCKSGGLGECESIGYSGGCFAVAVNNDFRAFGEFDPQTGTLEGAQTRAIADCIRDSGNEKGCRLWVTACPRASENPETSENPEAPKTLEAAKTAPQKTVDLSDQFPNPVRRQIGGLCYAYSSAALVESFCSREAHEDVQVSPAYLYYQNLAYNLTDFNPTAPVYPASLKADARGWIVEGWDGGWTEKVLNRIQARAVVSEEEFPTNQAFLDFFARLRDHSAPATDLHRFLVPFLNGYVGNEVASHRVRAAFNSNGSLDLLTEDAGLRKCVDQGFEVKREDFSFARAIELLERERIPFECTHAGHSTVVEGFRTIDAAGAVEFKVRDSVAGAEIWAAHECDALVYIK